jgi:farnesyl diphosphate synthase
MLGNAFPAMLMRIFDVLLHRCRTGNGSGLPGAGRNNTVSDGQSGMFQARMAQRAGEVERALRHYLASHPRDGEIARPDRLMAAMRHGVLNGGKRLRPFLVMESAAMFGAGEEAALAAAAALECIHCYSLIHDDLPAMDDDDLRRGQPTVHRAFDEATAILAGDALLTMAFDIVASSGGDTADNIRIRLVSELARAAGCGGMAGGQMLDLAAPGGGYGEEGVIRMQAMKTGALIRFACRAGAIAASAGDDHVERLSVFGEAIGLAFQIADDLLDVTGDAGNLGKAAGKDAGAGKATLVALHGTGWAGEQLRGLIAQARDVLSPYGDSAGMLLDAAQFVANRNR